MTRFPKALFGGLAFSLCCGSGAYASNDPLAPTGRWTAVAAGQAATPPMGWNSWNAFHTDVTEAKVLDSAKAIVDSGLAAKGYRYINIDDGWWLKRRTTDGRMVVRTSIFPSAAVGGREQTSFKPFTDRIHAMGLKAGIYSDIGANNCSQAFAPNAPNLPEGTAAEREVGLYGHIDQDIELYFRDWAFDYIKVDACGLRAFGPGSDRVKSGQYRALGPLIDVQEIRRTDIQAVRGLYQHVADALRRANPDGDYVLSICAWGSADVRAWAKDVGNLSRTSDDITPSWTRMLANFDSAADRPLYAHPGSWNDPDMLFVGHGDFDERHLSEAKSHFALWAMLSAPLLIGYDLRNAPRPLMDILGNSNIIAVDQDPAGNQAVLAYDTDDVQILVKTLRNGHKAVAIFNRGLAPADVTLTAGHMKFAATAPVTLKDLWTDATLPAFSGETKVHLDPRQTLIFDAAGTRTLADGLYLSEMTGRVNPAVDGVVIPQPDPTIQRKVGLRAGQEVVHAPTFRLERETRGHGRPMQIEIEQIHVVIGDARQGRGHVGRDEGLAHIGRRRGNADQLDLPLFHLTHDLRTEQLERPRARVRVTEAHDILVPELLGQDVERLDPVDRREQRLIQFERGHRSGTPAFC